jgi:hypothetical protein
MGQVTHSAGDPREPAPDPHRNPVTDPGAGTFGRHGLGAGDRVVAGLRPAAEGREPQSVAGSPAPPGGLSSAHARALLAELGPNTVPQPRPNILARLAGKLRAPVPWMLEATIGLEVALGKWLDAAIVAAVLALNAALGLVQEGRAQAALALLRHRLAVNARVPLPATVAALVLAAVIAAAFAADLGKVPVFKALGLHRLWRTPPPAGTAPGGRTTAVSAHVFGEPSDRLPG